MSNETYIKKLNNFLSKKTYSYKDDTFSLDYTIELTGEIKPMITIGEWTDYNMVSVKIFNLSNVLKRILSFMLEKDPEYSDLKKNDIYDVKVPLRRLGIERHLGASAKKLLRTLNINNIMTKEKIYWKMRNGNLIDIDDMDIEHLRNTLKLVLRNRETVIKRIVEAKSKRKFKLQGDMANEFNKSQYENDEYDESLMH